MTCFDSLLPEMTLLINSLEEFIKDLICDNNKLSISDLEITTPIKQKTQINIKATTDLDLNRIKLL